MTSAYTVVSGDLSEHRAAVLVVALSGWIDASGAAGGAIATLEAECSASTVVVFDGDSFIDYRARRPTMELREGVNTRLIWPNIELKIGSDLSGNKILLLTGPEPDMGWHRFGREVAELASALGVEKMIALGAYPFATPHTRESRLSISAPSADLVASLSFRKNSVDVPAGVAAVLEHALHDRGIEAMGIWVQVPHYVASMAYPAATVALLCGLMEVAGVAVDGSAPRRETIIQRQRLDELVAGNDDHRAMVQQLETLYDANEADGADDNSAIRVDPAPLSAAELPSADELGAELEQFLRDQDGA